MLVIIALLVTSAIAIAAKYKSRAAYAYAKTLPILVLIAIASRYFLDNPQSTFHLLILLGITVGCAGDFFLLRRSFFIPGLIAFLLGHVLFAAAFLTRPWILSSLWPIVLLLVGVVFYVVLLRRMGADRVEKYRVPVALYFISIIVMTATAWNYAWYFIPDAPSRWLLILGGAMFPLADGLLGWVKFAGGFRGDEFWKSVTYYAAQSLIILGALRFFAN